MKIGILQPAYQAGSPAKTIDYILQQLEAAKGHDLVVLPEYSNCTGISAKNELLSFTREHTPRLLEGVKKIAKANSTAVAVNAVLNDGPDALRNTTLLIDRNGEEVFRYVKTHLTASEQNDWQLTPGDGAKYFDFEGTRLGFLTCFEIYFPEYVEKLAGYRPDVVIFPTYQRSEDSKVIVRQTAGRALDLEAFIARASYSQGDGSATGGQSMIVNPSGEVVVNAEQKVGLFSCTIDAKQKRPRPINHGLPKVSSRQIVEESRRPELYRPSGRPVASRDATFPRVCAHRGVTGLCPESTLPSFAAAISLGADEIELDVWESQDGELVVCHDDTLDRTTTGKGKFCDMPWEKLRQLDNGSWFRPEWAGTRVCNLRQVLELCAGRVGMNIHMKEPGTEGSVIRKVYELVKEFQITRDVYFAGYRDILEWSTRIAPEIDRCSLDGQLDDTVLDSAIKYECKRVQFWAPHFNDAEIKRAHDHGILCNLFECNDADEAGRLYDRGIDNILTDFANRIVPVARERKRYAAPTRD